MVSCAPARLISHSLVTTAAALVAVALAGCAVLTCQPTGIVVARKEERARVENVSRGLYRTTETGRLGPVRAPGVTREYWVKAEGGEWHRVTADQWKTAEVNRSMEVCQ